MTNPTVFISYSHKDEEWVKNWFLPKFENNGFQAHIDYRDFEIGVPSLINMERAVETCAKTILVFTPNWVESEYAQFESILLQSEDPIGTRKRILPIMLCDCKPPKRLRIFTYADFRNENERDFQLQRLKKQIKRDFVEVEEKVTYAPPNKVDIAHLPQTGYELFGRQEELKLLNESWETGKVNVLSFVAYGGTGKSTLINKWLEKLRWDNYRGAQKVFAWSFYSQGTSERVTSADQFVTEALTWFGDPDPAAGSPWDKGQRLAGLVRREKTLLLLDGMEPLQSGHDFERGKIQDPALAMLVAELARQNPGLCVITTREAVADLRPFEDTAIEKNLEQISAQAGRALLRVGGVRGEEAELEAASRAFGNHALALNLLSAYLRDIPGHHIAAAEDIPDLPDVPVRDGKHPRRVMAAFAERFGDGPEVALLHLLGVFDRPAEGAALNALREPPAIPALTEHILEMDEADWLRLLGKLRDAKLLAAESSHRPHTLDTHPLVREHFGAQLRAQHPQAWRAANDRLYEHYKEQAPYQPDTLAEMAPLFQAVAHGCAAGRHQEVLDNVYFRRIARGNEAFVVKKLGAFGSDLAALSNFFDPLWRQPVSGITGADQAWVLNRAGFHLRALGRLAEAAQPMQVSLEALIDQENWEQAARAANNLSELHLTRGDVPAAVDVARQSVELADRSGDAFLRMGFRTTLADALHQAGRLDEAAAAFEEAEAIQKEDQPTFPLLYSLQGCRYCDLLLSQGRYQEVQERAAQTLEWAMQQRVSLLDIALGHLSLGRALTMALPPGPSPNSGRGGQNALPQSWGRVGEGADEAAQHLNQAVDGLRQAGTQEFIIHGLLARAALHRATGNFERAQRDLSEAMQITTRGGMRLHECDAHLEYVRLYKTLQAQDLRGFQNLGGLEEAREHLSKAKALIDETGYHRRDGEAEALEERLQPPNEFGV